MHITSLTIYIGKRAVRKIVNKGLQTEGKYEGCSSKVERVGKDGYLQMQTNEPSFKAMK